MAFKLALVAAVALLAVGSAVAQPQFDTIGAALNGTEDLKILNALANTTTDYLDTLGNITIFAPTDTAFTNAFRGLNYSEDQVAELLKNETLVVDLLSYHVYTNGSIRIYNFTDGEKLVMLNNKTLTVSVNESAVASDGSIYTKTTLQTGVSNATVKGKNGIIEAGNATINLINAVLIPESLAYLIPVNGTGVPPPAPSSASLYSAAPLALVGGLLMALML